MTQPNDASKKSPRSFQCRDQLWETFEQMARELECSIDYLINEAMKQYARQRSYGAAGGARTPYPGIRESSAAMQAMETNRPPPATAPAVPMARGVTPAMPPAVPPQGARLPPPPPSGGRGAMPLPPPPISRAPQGAPPPPPMGGRGGPPPIPRGPASMPPQMAGMNNPGSMGGVSGMGGPIGNPMQPMGGMGGHPLPPPPMQSMGMQPQHHQQQQQQPMMGGPPPIPHGAVQNYLGGLTAIYQGERTSVNKEKFIIGRGRQASDLTIKDPNVSRQHAMIEFQNGVYYMVDLGSTNGVEFHGQRVTRKAIAEGDVFRICDHEVVFTYR